MAEYVITIQEVRERERIGSEYVKLADTGGKDGGAAYGYVPKSTVEEDTVEVFSQRTDTLDLAAVICAVNKIKAA